MAAWVLIGMRVPRSKLKLFQEVQIGARRLGSPTTTVQEPLNAIDDIARLHRMGERVLDVATWQELPDTP